MLKETVLREHGIDMSEGLAYCADDPEFYEEMLREYVIEGQDKTGELREFFASEDWSNYAIRAHSVKNTSKMIGAEELSEQARALELAAKELVPENSAAKEQNAAAVREMHEDFLDAYQHLLGALDEMLG